MRKTKQMRKEEKANITFLCTSILCSPSQAEKEIVNKAIPHIRNSLWISSFSAAFMVLLTSGIAWGCWQNHKNWLDLFCFLLPAFFLYGLVVCIKDDYKTKKYIQAIEKGSYTVAAGNSIYCSTDKWNCSVYGFIGEPPQGFSCYDDFPNSINTIFVEFSISKEFIATTWDRQFLYVNVDEGSFVIASLPNGRILTAASVHLDRNAPYYVFEAYKKL